MTKKISYILISLILISAAAIGSTFLFKKKQIFIMQETANQGESNKEENNIQNVQQLSGNQEAVDPMAVTPQESSESDPMNLSPKNDGKMPSQITNGAKNTEGSISTAPVTFSGEPALKIESVKSADLQTYKNSEFAFQLSYPKSWNLQEQPNIQTFSLLINSPQRKKEIDEFKNGTVMGPSPSSDVLVNVHKNPEKNLTTFVSKQAFSSEVQKISVAGVSAFGGNIRDNDSTYSIFRENKGVIYEFVFGNGVTSFDGISVEGKGIITSLKF